MLRRTATAFILLAFAAHPALANCVCSCVNGAMQPLCTSAIDLPPICPLSNCGIVPPSIKPIQPLGLPPLGTTRCDQVQVMDPGTGQYQWRTVCR